MIHHLQFLETTIGLFKTLVRRSNREFRVIFTIYSLIKLMLSKGVHFSFYGYSANQGVLIV